MKQTKHLMTTIAVLLYCVVANAEIRDSGTCGDNLNWFLTTDGELVIQGTGRMTDYNWGEAPWIKYDYLIEIVSIKEGVTYIGKCAFGDFYGPTLMNVPNSVTEIGAQAFTNCEGGELILDCNMAIPELAFADSRFTKVSIGDGVTSIGNGAFADCCNLTSITIPESVNSIGDRAFLRCSSLTSITIPGGVNSIGGAAFSGCSSLSSITILEGVAKIEGQAFEGCNSLTSITIPKSLTRMSGSFLECHNDSLFVNGNIPSGAFLGGQFTKVIIGSGVTSIGYCAFANCYNLTSITIPESVTSIKESAFHNCNSLTSITIPERVTLIGESAFENCNSLTSITIPERVDSVGQSAFSGCNSLTSITIPESVTFIGRYAFEGCTGELIVNCNIPYFAFEDSDFTKAIIGDKVTSIGIDAFKNCNNLISIIFPESVTKIENDAFDGTAWYDKQPEGIVYAGNVVYKYKGSVPENTSIEIKEGTVSISPEAFEECSNPTAIIIPESVTHIGSSAFSGCTGKLTVNCNIPSHAFSNSDFNAIKIGANVTSIGNSAFLNCDLLTSIVIPENITEIGKGIFAGCENLTSIVVDEKNPSYDSRDNCNAIIETNTNTLISSCTATVIPQSVEAIGNYAFESHRDLISINIPKGLKKIGDAAFYECWSLTSVTIPEGVTSIGYIAFAGCWGLTSITLPQSITEIGAFAFEGCYSLESITCKATNPPSCSEAFDGFMSEGVNRTIPVYVPDASVSAYKEAEEWKEFINIMPLSSKNDKYVLTYLVDGEVYRTDSLDYDAPIVLPEEPTKEGYTFSGWSEVPETMPENDVTVSGTFIKNKYLVTFKIGDEVVAADSLEYGASIVAPEAPEKEGYTFDGWGEVVETVPANDVTIEGSYSVNSYLLTYTVDGETVQMDSVAYGTAITLLDEPLKEGHTFSGWSEAPETMPANDVVISGTFAINKYLVTFKIGDEVIAADSLEYGATVVAPEAPEKEGYTFNGWGDVVETVPANDLTYEGSYSVNSYLLTYTIDGETVQADSVAYGTAITLLDEPTKEGHTFSGWSEAPETMPASDVIISGTFTVNKYLVTFKIGDEVIAADSLEYGASIVAPEAPEKEGYTFDGWGEVAETVPANNVTYEGSYSVNSYLLTYTVDGETVQTDSVAYGTAITLLDEPTKEGHTFSGWSEAPETMPASDVIISGTFTVNKYLVTFKIGDEVIAADSLEYGATIVAPEAPEKEGYTFNGWGEVAEIVPANDVTIEGTYTVNIYKVYYYVGEELVHTAEVAYGEAIPEYIYEPTAEGDVFLGWVGESYETMPAHDVTYTANIDDAIRQLTIDNGKLTIYDLTGRKIEVDDLRELRKGIYIINGQKMIIKE